MPKQIRGNPRRKPPEPSTDHSAIDQWFGEVMPEQAADRAERGRVDSRGGPEPAVRRKVPPRVLRAARTRVDHRDCPYFKSVNILFLGGAGFDPPPPLGSTGRTRYVKITTVEEGQHPDVRVWIEQAGHTPGWT